MRGRCRVGTSGWVYPDWVGPFYPPGLPEREWLSYYATRFDTVEINRSFYRLPTPEASEAWGEEVPPDFLFAVKASRYLTHMKKLKDPQEPLRRLFEALQPLGPKLGPVLYQLPPHWHFNPERLAAFLAALPQGFRHAIEFRDPSWFTSEAYRLLERFGVALCAVSFPGVPLVFAATAPFAYFRLHGTTLAYDYRYRPEELEEWARQGAAFLSRGLDLYTYFDNSARAQAVGDALAFRSLLNPPSG